MFISFVTKTVFVKDISIDISNDNIIYLLLSTTLYHVIEKSELHCIQIEYYKNPENSKA